MPVVVLTGVTEVEPAEAEVIERHGAHLLYKRFGYREVVQRLEKIITAKRRSRSAFLNPLRLFVTMNEPSDCADTLIQCARPC